MEQWEKNYYISSIAGASNGSSLVVMSKGLCTLKVCYILLAYRYILVTLANLGCMYFSVWFMGVVLPKFNTTKHGCACAR